MLPEAEQPDVRAVSDVDELSGVIESDQEVLRVMTDVARALHVEPDDLMHNLHVLMVRRYQANPFLMRQLLRLELVKAGLFHKREDDRDDE